MKLTKKNKKITTFIGVLLLIFLMGYLGSKYLSAWIPQQGYDEKDGDWRWCPSPGARISTNFGFILGGGERFVPDNYFTYSNEQFSSINFGGEEIYSTASAGAGRYRSLDVSEILNKKCSVEYLGSCTGNPNCYGITTKSECEYTDCNWLSGISESAYSGYYATCWVSFTATCSPKVVGVDYGHIRFAGGSIVTLKPEDTLSLCSDKKDNDFNGRIDCDDKNCKIFTICASIPENKCVNDFDCEEGRKCTEGECLIVTTTTTIPPSPTTTTIPSDIIPEQKEGIPGWAIIVISLALIIFIFFFYKKKLKKK